MKHVKHIQARVQAKPVGRSHPDYRTKIELAVLDPRWLKVTILYRELHQLGVGLGLAAHLQLENLCQLIYFARYTSPPYRLEMQLYTRRSMASIKKAIVNYRSNAPSLQITFEPCNGSVAHAVAFNVVTTLAATNQLGALTDVFHYMCNMAGFSYVQEASFLAEHSAHVLRNLPGWTNNPIFTLHAKKTKMQKLRTRSPHRQ